MPTVEASIVINASVDEVFAVMDDPQRVKEYMPGLLRYMTTIIRRSGLGPRL